MTINNTFSNQKRDENNTFYKTNVANNVAQRNSQDLTKQWRKGELKTGWYYVKNEFGNIFMSEYSKDYDFIGERVISGFFTEVSEIIEIICEVPSYEQWQQMKAFCEEFNTLEVAEENRELKELLKRCRDFINYEVPDHCIDDVLIDKIDEVLNVPSE